jgi:cellulose synthase/poly-beta-1,6-N-acetylglucosamine synthase-like glycosyltransferase
MLQGGWLPIRQAGSVVTIGSATPDRIDLQAEVTSWLPSIVAEFETLDVRSIQNSIVQQRQTEVAEHIGSSFARSFPQQSAHSGLERWQVLLASVVLILGLGCVIVAPSLVALVITALTAAMTIVTAAISGAGLLERRARSGLLEPLPDDLLPKYTILVPAYREESVIGRLVKALSDLDYPKDRLEVLILTECDDKETRQAAASLVLPDFVRLIDVPPGQPKTKPRACNLGLLLAGGDLLVIFDGEDLPEGDQLRKAAATFARSSERLACVQAKLNFYNPDQNLLTHALYAEYSVKFEIMLFGEARLCLPIPLGGTSNHFRTEVLRALGGWDPWNVTEDADLGLRCAADNYSVSAIDATTWEEATTQIRPWVRQHTRWYKGFLMTTAVHLRDPVESWRRFGGKGMLSLLALVTAVPVGSMLYPVVLLLIPVTLGALPWFPFAFVGGATSIGFSLVVTLTSWTALNIMLAQITNRASARWRIALIPLYWFLQSIAAWRALYQLFRAPHVWEKTPHGLARMQSESHIA